MISQIAAASTYRVEISGWDSGEKFFVEMADLEWSEEKKLVHMRHSLRPGAVVFVRLLGNPTRSSVYPVAYKSVQVSFQPELNAYEVLLAQLLPQSNAPDPSDDLLN
jgi:hypothetical protein